jgi:hypothetical protein
VWEQKDHLRTGGVLCGSDSIANPPGLPLGAIASPRRKKPAAPEARGGPD